MRDPEVLAGLLARLDASGQTLTAFAEALRAEGVSPASLWDLRKCAYLALESPRLLACVRRVVRASMEAQLERAPAMAPRTAETRAHLLRWAVGDDATFTRRLADFVCPVDASSTVAQACWRDIHRLAFCVHQVCTLPQKINAVYYADTAALAAEAAVDATASTDVAWNTLMDACRELDEYVQKLFGENVVADALNVTANVIALSATEPTN